jgi:transcriptional regulator with XRE-family HTH domain
VVYLRLRAERHRRGLSQRALGRAAKLVGGLHRELAQEEISAIEIGRVNPRPAELGALAKVFGVPPEALLRPVVVDDAAGTEALTR